jgi:hypothetical protein
MTPGNPRGRAPADQRQALYVATVADDHASQRPAQNRRPDGLGLDLDLHKLVAFPPAKREPRSNAGMDCGTRGGLGTSCESWPRDSKIALEQLGPLKPLPALEALSTT